MDEQKTPEILWPALRQYRHNIGKDKTLFAGFDYKETVEIVTTLQAKVEELTAENERLFKSAEFILEKKQEIGNEFNDFQREAYPLVDALRAEVTTMEAKVEELSQERDREKEVSNRLMAAWTVTQEQVTYLRGLLTGSMGLDESELSEFLTVRGDYPEPPGEQSGECFY